MPNNRHGKMADTWWGSTSPPTRRSLAVPTWLGVTLQFTVAGRLMGFRCWKDASDAQQPAAILYDTTNNLFRATKAFHAGGSYPSATWHQTWIRPTYRITVGQQYRLIIAVAGYYYVQAGALTSPVTRNGIQFINGFNSANLSPIANPPTTDTDARAIDVLFLAD